MDYPNNKNVDYPNNDNVDGHKHEEAEPEIDTASLCHLAMLPSRSPRLALTSNEFYGEHTEYHAWCLSIHC